MKIVSIFKGRREYNINSHSLTRVADGQEKSIRYSFTENTVLQGSEDLFIYNTIEHQEFKTDQKFLIARLNKLVHCNLLRVPDIQ